MWLTGAQVYDVHSGSFTPGDVEVAGDVIGTVGAAPEGSESIDLAGAYLLPGFFDCHVHLCVDTRAPDPGTLWHDALPGTIALHAAENARRLLRCGITTARDLGGWDYHEIAVREAIEAGTIPGPHLACAGKLLSITSSTTPYYPGMYEEADGVAQVRVAVRKQFAKGADLIKMLATGAITSTKYEKAEAIQFRRSEIEEAVGVAADNQTYVAAHAHADEGIRNAVEAGVRSIEHGTYAEPATHELMVERGVFLVPTACTTPAMMQDPELSTRVPAHIRDRYEASHERAIESLIRARRLGVRIAMGTDAGTPGNHFGDNMQELEVMVIEAGFSPAEAIRSATLEAAALMGVEDSRGEIAVGKAADLIAVPGDPLLDVRALRSVFFVMKAGRVFRDDRAA